MDTTKSGCPNAQLWNLFYVMVMFGTRGYRSVMILGLQVILILGGVGSSPGSESSDHLCACYNVSRASSGAE